MLPRRAREGARGRIVRLPLCVRIAERNDAGAVAKERRREIGEGLVAGQGARERLSHKRRNEASTRCASVSAASSEQTRTCARSCSPWRTC
eukprot:5877555-Pleurochrysis_carterae.AAC.1